MQLAGEYAYAGRDVVVDRVLEILGTTATKEVHNHHNYAWRERHFDTDVWVVRKGRRHGRTKEGLVDFDAVQAELVAAGVELRGGAADEAPAAYKRLDAVLAAHGDTIEVLHRLTPIGVAMAAAGTEDPYKD
jgi:tRNA-splicing ligase RtcB